jgi:carbohydrate-binding DOMON domain-containing protein
MNIPPENMYTTTITERHITTLTITKIETINVTVTTHLTRTSTIEIPITTSGITIVQRTILVPPRLEQASSTLKLLQTWNAMRLEVQLHAALCGEQQWYA